MDQYFRIEITPDGHSEQFKQIALVGIHGDYMVVDEGGPVPEGYRLLSEGEQFVSRVPYGAALAALSADYQADIAALTNAFATATLMGGAAMDTKHNAIRAQFTARKNEYLADYAALRAKYGV